jgi:hypothetical protein
MACNQNGSTKDQVAGSKTSNVVADTFGADKQETALVRLKFKNITEVLQDKESDAWVELKGNSTSLSLHFNLGYKDTLAVSCTQECWLMYPFKTDNDKIIVFWDNNIDSKYDFDIVKAINNVDKKYIGKPFMILELINDSTLKATYPIPDLIREINSSSKNRTYFPDKFIVSQEYYL